MATAAAAVAWTQVGVPIRENVFFGGVNGHLIELWFDGNQWNVSDHGQPAGTGVAAAPTAVTWRDPAGSIRLNVFYEGGNGNLVERWFDGNQWNTTDHGKPAGLAVASQAAAVTWSHQGQPIRENVFYRGANGNLIEIWFG